MDTDCAYWSWRQVTHSESIRQNITWLLKLYAYGIADYATYGTYSIRKPKDIDLDIESLSVIVIVILIASDHEGVCSRTRAHAHTSWSWQQSAAQQHCNCKRFYRSALTNLWSGAIWLVASTGSWAVIQVQKLYIQLSTWPRIASWQGPSIQTWKFLPPNSQVQFSERVLTCQQNFDTQAN